MFGTCAERAASLNALDAVARAGVSVTLGFLALDFFGVDFFDEAAGEDGGIDGSVNDGGTVAGKNTCGIDVLVGLGPGPKRDVVDVSGVAVTAGVVVAATFGGSCTI